MGGLSSDEREISVVVAISTDATQIDRYGVISAQVSSVYTVLVGWVALPY